MQHTQRGRWALLLMTVIAVGLTILGFQQAAAHQGSVGLLAIIVGSLVYAFAWMIALLDAVQARHQRWALALILLLAFGIGPLLYALVGLQHAGNTNEQKASSPEKLEQAEHSEQSIDVA